MPADQFGAKPYSNPTPMVPPQRVDVAKFADASNRGGLQKTVARRRRAALHIQQRCVPGVTDLTGEKAQAGDLGRIGEKRVDKADVRTAERCPVACASKPNTTGPACQR